MLFANISRILTRRNNLYLLQSQSSLTRKLATTSLLAHGDYEWEEPKSPEDIVNMTYIDRDNIEHRIRGKVGDNVLFLAHRHDIDIEGACEAALVSHIRGYDGEFTLTFRLVVHVTCMSNQKMIIGTSFQNPLRKRKICWIWHLFSKKTQGSAVRLFLIGIWRT